MKTKILLTVCVGFLGLNLLAESWASRRSTTAPIYRLTDRVERLERKFVDLERIENRIDLLEQKVFPGTKLKKDGTAQRISPPFKIGQIVYFDGDDKFKVIEIIDRQSMIVELRMRQQRGNTLYPIKQTVCISGYDTSKIADDELFKPSPHTLFIFEGTKSYDTLFTGRKTIYILKPFSFP